VDPKEIERERRARTTENLKAVLMSPYEKLYDVEPKEIEVEERGRTEYIAAV
jgi:hypothetical protein